MDQECHIASPGYNAAIWLRSASFNHREKAGLDLVYFSYCICHQEEFSHIIRGFSDAILVPQNRIMVVWSSLFYGGGNDMDDMEKNPSV